MSRKSNEGAEMRCCPQCGRSYWTSYKASQCARCRYRKERLKTGGYYKRRCGICGIYVLSNSPHCYCELCRRLRLHSPEGRCTKPPPDIEERIAYYAARVALGLELFEGSPWRAAALDASKPQRLQYG
jgi:hypothetical protein